MKKQIVIILVSCLFVGGITFAFHPNVKLSPNGISIPAEYKNWRIIAPSHRSDNNTIRVILGNDIAIKAARSGNIMPWPDGSILAKIVWKDINHDKWQSAVIPGKFVHAEFMIKDSMKYSSTGGWGFARWKGLEQKPYGVDADFVQECFGCHTPVKDNDYVFTKPAEMP
jgi:hypothetical protein